MSDERLRLLKEFAHSNTPEQVISLLMARDDVRKASRLAGGRIAVTASDGLFSPIKTNKYISYLLEGGAPQSRIDKRDTLSLEDAMQKLY